MDLGSVTSPSKQRQPEPNPFTGGGILKYEFVNQELYRSYYVNII